MQTQIEKFETYIDRFVIELEENWDHWYAAMPYIPIPQDCFIKPLPPIMGVMTRCVIKNKHDKKITITLDVDNRIRNIGFPYWLVQNNHETVIVKYDDYKSLGYLIFDELT